MPDRNWRNAGQYFETIAADRLRSRHKKAPSVQEWHDQCKGAERAKERIMQGNNILGSMRMQICGSSMNGKSYHNACTLMDSVFGPRVHARIHATSVPLCALALDAQLQCKHPHGGVTSDAGWKSMYSAGTMQDADSGAAPMDIRSRKELPSFILKGVPAMGLLSCAVVSMLQAPMQSWAGQPQHAGGRMPHHARACTSPCSCAP